MRRRIAPALALALCLAGTLSARAQETPTAAMGAIREMILHARYSDAIGASQQVLERTDLRASERNAVLELLATAQIAGRQTDAARETLATLYSRDPGHRLTDPDASPPVVSAFARAREASPRLVHVELQHEPVRLSRREPPTIVVRIGAGADAVEELRLAYRYVGDSGFSQVVMNHRPDGTWMGRIPVVGAADRAIDVAYYITAMAPSTARLAELGNEIDAQQVRIPGDAPSAASAAATLEPSERPPGAQSDDGGGGGGSVAEEPWLWILIGVLVAGGVTAAVVVATLPPQGPDQGSLGSIAFEH